MTRRRFVAGNWKLNLGPEAAVQLAEALRAALAGRGDVDVAVFPTTLSVHAVVPVLRGSGIEVGVQDVHWEDSGAHTGATSPAMARATGCTRALVGHSERRQHFGETDDDVRRKVRAALRAGLLPVLCVGETLEERDAGRAEEVVHRQLARALEGLEADEVATLTIAYEPVWAIGTGRNATPEQAQEVHAAIRAWLAAHYPAFVAGDVRIQYGGSVNASNAGALLAQPDVDGALVGGASLDPRAFAAIVAA